MYEFQTVGGPKNGSGVPGADAPGHVWTNNFSSVEPTSTAFPHRNARHCLMFKANSLTQDGFGPAAVRMRNVFEKVAVHVRGESPYYNHMDTYYSGVDQYFVAGVETLWEPTLWEPNGFMPPGMKVNKTYFLDKLSKVRAKYNVLGAMTNVRQVQLPVTSQPKCDLPPSPPSPPEDTCTDEADFTCKKRKCKTYSDEEKQQCKNTCDQCDALPPSAPPPSLPPALKCAGLEDSKNCKIKKCDVSARTLRKCKKQCKKKKLKKKCQKTCCDAGF